MDDCHGPSVATLPPPVTAGKQHVVAIVGPPNSGKSTLFNRLTGLRQKVANFPGVTVEHRMGRAKLDHHREIYVVDLPGVYSLQPRTEDERVTHLGHVLQYRQLQQRRLRWQMLRRAVEEFKNLLDARPL